MSAENWAQCPKCFDKFTKERKSIYGSVSEENYHVEVKRIENAIKAQNLREDYEIGIDLNSKFYVKYCGHCSFCGFHYEFNTGSKV